MMINIEFCWSTINLVHCDVKFKWMDYYNDDMVITAPDIWLSTPKFQYQYVILHISSFRNIFVNFPNHRYSSLL